MHKRHKINYILHKSHTETCHIHCKNKNNNKYYRNIHYKKILFQVFNFKMSRLIHRVTCFYCNLLAISKRKQFLLHSLSV